MEQESPSPSLNPPQPPVIQQPAQSKSSRRRRIILLIAVVVVACVAGGIGWWFGSKSDGRVNMSSDNDTQSNSSHAKQVTTQGLQLDKAKNYGDKYADGILPVGDSQYVTDAASKGKLYMCNANFVPSAQAGAQTRGPWFIGTTQWNMNKKYAVRGEVTWDQAITNTVSGDKRVITTNNLPDHITGTFPVGSSDPAYQYDRNPNSIKSQSLTYTLSSKPSYGEPQCMGGEVGVMLTGVALFNAFDAGGRDAGAWEIQDACEGHPQSSGLYHYHTLSSCVKDVSVGTVIGFALDGFPITGPKVDDGNYLTTRDLDECHGIVSEITLDDKKITSYHYVMTQDFPYSASCFRAAAAQPPGQHSGGQQTQAQQPQQQSQPTGTQPGQQNTPPPRQ